MHEIVSKMRRPVEGQMKVKNPHWVITGHLDV
jgi:hypothetical protein